MWLYGIPDSFRFGHGKVGDLNHRCDALFLHPRLRGAAWNGFCVLMLEQDLVWNEGACFSFWFWFVFGSIPDLRVEDLIGLLPDLGGVEDLIQFRLGWNF